MSFALVQSSADIIPRSAARSDDGKITTRGGNPNASPRQFFGTDPEFRETRSCAPLALIADQHATLRLQDHLEQKRLARDSEASVERRQPRRGRSEQVPAQQALRLVLAHTPRLPGGQLLRARSGASAAGRSAISPRPLQQEFHL